MIKQGIINIQNQQLFPFTAWIPELNLPLEPPKKSSTNAYRRNLTMKVTSNTRTVIYFHRRFWLLGISCKKLIGTANGFRAENRIGKKRITSPARVRHLHNRITTSPIYLIGSKRLHGFTKNLCLILLQP